MSHHLARKAAIVVFVLGIVAGGVLLALQPLEAEPSGCISQNSGLPLPCNDLAAVPEATADCVAAETGVALPCDRGGTVPEDEYEGPPSPDPDAGANDLSTSSLVALLIIAGGALVAVLLWLVPSLSNARASWSRQGAAADMDEQVEINKAGVGMVVAGATLLVIASFLPQLEAPGIIPIKQNTLAQNGEWWFIGAAVIAVAATYRVFQQRTTSYAPLVIGVIAIGIAVYDGTGGRLELVSIATGESLGPAASPGVGLYAAGFGGALVAYGGALLAGWGIWPGGKQLPARRTRTCPDCAETVLAEARVCKHCGYRLDAPEG